MIKKSKDINLNYAAKVCRVDAIEPITGADRIVNAVLGNDKAIVSNEIKVGDIVVFFPCETVICDEYLAHHNLYDDFTKNSNATEYESLRDNIAALQADKAHDNNEAIANGLARLKKMKGFFNKTGRVRMLKLRGEYSLGYVTPIRTLEEVWPSLKTIIWSRYLNEQFDMVDDKLICWKYMPHNNRKSEPKEYNMPWYKRSMRGLKKFDRLVPGQFAFHYDTGKLADNMHAFNPWDDIDMTVKVHGTSVIISNILTNKKLTAWEKIKKFFGVHIAEQVYDVVYSSRRVIKNRYINPYNHNNYYSTDVHGCVARDFAQFIRKGMTVYGEIVGYCEGEDKFIQKNHDYGCKPGCWKFMPYRITETNHEGVVTEWEVDEVIEWTKELIETCKSAFPDLVDKIMPMTLLYHGRAGDMYNQLYAQVAAELNEEDYEREKKEYPDNELPWYLETPENYVIHHWRTAWLDAMKHDTKFIGLEKREPMCKNKVPREGVVIRKCHDPRAEAFKLKSAAHFHMEMMQHDAGEADMEEES